MKYFNENKQIVKALEGIKTLNSVSAGNWKQVDDETIRPQYSLKPVTITGEHPMWSLPGYQGKLNEYRNLTLKDKNLIYKNALHRDEVGRQYAKFAAPAAMSPLIPILGLPTLASNLVSTAVNAPLETAMSVGGGLLGGNYVDRKVNQITGDANFGEMIGRVTGTPELSGVYLYGNPGYVVGGFLGEGLSPLVRSVAKGALKVGRSAINSFQRIGDEIAGRIGSELSPAVATAGEVATETPVKESFMAFAKRRNKGGSNKTKTDGGKTNKENSKDTTQQLENKVEQNVQNPAEVETSTQAPEKLVEREAPVETSTQAPVEAEVSTKTSTENPERLIEREVEVEPLPEPEPEPTPGDLFKQHPRPESKRKLLRIEKKKLRKIQRDKTWNSGKAKKADKRLSEYGSGYDNYEDDLEILLKFSKSPSFKNNSDIDYARNEITEALKRRNRRLGIGGTSATALGLISSAILLNKPKKTNNSNNNQSSTINNTPIQQPQVSNPENDSILNEVNDSVLNWINSIHQ